MMRTMVMVPFLCICVVGCGREQELTYPDGSLPRRDGGWFDAPISGDIDATVDSGGNAGTCPPNTPSLYAKCNEPALLLCLYDDDAGMCNEWHCKNGAWMVNSNNVPCK